MITMRMSTKPCSQCKHVKQIIEFYKEKKGAQGVKGKCKDCIEENKKKYRELNIEKINATTRIYQRTDKYKAKKRQNRKRPHVVAYNQQYKRDWNFKNREKNATKSRERARVDPQFRIKRSLRTRLYRCLKGHCKSASTEDLLGCSYSAFKAHVQSLFKTGMCWENYGDWHIDHRLPCQMFNLTLDSEQKKCFHYSNLQPLWKKDNLTKGGTFDIEEDTLTSIYLLFE